MTMLEPTLYDQEKVQGVAATILTIGIAAAHIKMVSSVRNAHSNVRVTDPNAVFYFYFDGWM